MVEPMTLAEEKLAKKREIAGRAENDYWEAFSAYPGVPAMLLKDYVLSIAPQTGLLLTQPQRDARARARNIIDRCIELNRQVNQATTIEEVGAVIW